MVSLPLDKILKDRTRQDIIELLGDNGNSSYTDILQTLNLSTGRLNYHLKVLAPFLQKSSEGYSLNETGENAFAILRKFPVIPNGNNKIYRSLSLMLLALSLAFMLTGYFYVQVIGIALLFVGIFFFYNSGNTRINLMEFVVILTIGLIAGSFGALPQVDIYSHGAYAIGPLITNLLFALYSIVIFATAVAWSLTTVRRWILGTAAMLSVTLYFYVILQIGISSWGWGGGTTSIMPLPAIFLFISVISKTITMYNDQTSIEVS